MSGSKWNYHYSNEVVAEKRDSFSRLYRKGKVRAFLHIEFIFSVSLKGKVGPRQGLEEFQGYRQGAHRELSGLPSTVLMKRLVLLNMLGPIRPTVGT